MQVDQEGQSQGDQQNEDNSSSNKVSWIWLFFKANTSIVYFPICFLACKIQIPILLFQNTPSVHVSNSLWDMYRQRENEVFLENDPHTFIL